MPPSASPGLRGWLVLAGRGQRLLGGSAAGVTTVSSGPSFVRLLRETRPRLAVVSVPPAGSLELLAAVAERRLRPALRLILLNDPDDVAGRLEALGLGFDDAFPCSIDPTELIGRARLLLDDDHPRATTDRPVLVAAGTVLDVVGRRVHRHGAEIHLRPKEFALLALLATDPGRAFTRLELLDRVWGPGYRGSARTVDVHVRWLRAKLEPDPSKPVHVVTVRGTGYRLDPPETGADAPTLLIKS